MSRQKILIVAVVMAVSLSGALWAQSSSAQQPPSQQPQLKVNLLNVCAPSHEEQKELSAALAKVPAKPAFAKDYEVARGHSTLDPNMPMPGMQQLPSSDAASADWVRVRREFPNSATFSTVQYSFSVDASSMIETLVLRVRDPKDLMQVSVEDSASAVTSASAMLSSDTPVSRIRLERFGKPSVALSRCPAEEGRPAPDQTAYEPIFRAATTILTRYREALGVRKIVPQELARMGKGKGTPSKAKPR
ncbi:MAG: hypothetical protein WA213_11080 [Terriglobales bacterium]